MFCDFCQVCILNRRDTPLPHALHLSKKMLAHLRTLGAPLKMDTHTWTAPQVHPRGLGRSSAASVARGQAVASSPGRARVGLLLRTGGEMPAGQLRASQRPWGCPLPRCSQGGRVKPPSLFCHEDKGESPWLPSLCSGEERSGRALMKQPAVTTRGLGVNHGRLDLGTSSTVSCP